MTGGQQPGWTSRTLCYINPRYVAPWGDPGHDVCVAGVGRGRMPASLQARLQRNHSDSHLHLMWHLRPAPFLPLSTRNVLSPYFFWSHMSDSYSSGCTTTHGAELQPPKQTIGASLERNPRNGSQCTSPCFWPPFIFSFIHSTLRLYKLWFLGKSLNLSVLRFGLGFFYP